MHLTDPDTTIINSFMNVPSNASSNVTRLHEPNNDKTALSVFFCNIFPSKLENGKTGILCPSPWASLTFRPHTHTCISGTGSGLTFSLQHREILTTEPRIPPVQIWYWTLSNSYLWWNYIKLQFSASVLYEPACFTGNIWLGRWFLESFLEQLYH